MIQKIIQLAKSLSRSKEKYTDRGGFLSYAGEFHALIIGLGVGVYSALTGDIALLIFMLSIALGTSWSGFIAKRYNIPKKISGEVKREPWYTIGGIIVAYIVTFVATNPQVITGALP